MFNLFRHCRKDEISFDIVAKNGNNVEATLDILERIVQLVAFDNVAWTLLLVWTGLNAARTITGLNTPAMFAVGNNKTTSATDCNNVTPAGNTRAHYIPDPCSYYLLTYSSIRSTASIFPRYLIIYPYRIHAIRLRGRGKRVTMQYITVSIHTS